MEKFTYLSAQNVGYIEDLFQTFLQNPSAVDPEWRMFFEGIEFAKKIGGIGSALSGKELKVYDLIRAYRMFGHLKASIDPLALNVRYYPERIGKIPFPPSARSPESWDGEDLSTPLPE